MVPYKVALVTPFGGRLIKWYLDGRKTSNEKSTIEVHVFDSPAAFLSAPTEWQAVVVYDDFFPACREIALRSSMVVVIERRYGLSNIAPSDSMKRIQSPIELLSVLPIAPFSSHRASKQLLAVIVAILVAAIVWAAWPM